MGWSAGQKVTIGGKSRVVRRTKRGKLFVSIGNKKRYLSQAKVTGKPRGRPKGSTKKTTKKRVSSGRGRGRPKMAISSIPKLCCSPPDKSDGKWFTLQSKHSSKKAALRAAPKQHRIRKMAGKFVLYTRNR